MNSNRVIWIMVGLAVLFGAVYFFIGGGRQSKYNWNTALRSDKNEPYDLSVFYKTLKDEYGPNYEEIPANSGFFKQKEKLSAEEGDVYFFAGKKPYLTDLECKELALFISKGGHVFFATNSVPYVLMKYLHHGDVYTRSLYSEDYYVSFSNPNIKNRNFHFLHWYRYEKSENNWNVVKFQYDSEQYDDTLAIDVESELVTISQAGEDSAGTNAGSDFISINFGKGKFYYLANPVLLSNYYLTKDEGRKYLSVIFSHIPDKKLWVDWSAAIPKPEATFSGNRSNMLDFIRNEKALWHAWVLLLAGVGLFLVFGGRRKQRCIPVLEPPVNHTMAFIDAVGRFYKTEKQNALVFKREWNQFNIYVRQHFRMTFSADELQMKKLAERSGVKEETIKNIIVKYEKYRIFSELQPDELTDINSAINQFYKEHKTKYGKPTERTGTAQSA